jgi:hypothetical protein
MNELTNITPALDGFEFGDEDDRNITKGEKIKFTLDFRWEIARSGEVIDPQREFLVAGILRVMQKWIPGQNKPETRILAPNEKFPDLKKLNDEAPRSEWRDKFGKQVGPYQGAHIVYLIENAETVSAFTWIADIDTAGASRAVKELRETTQLTRRVRGQANLLPIATLSDTFMPTQYGGRQRAHFNILGYKSIGPEPEPPAQIEHAKPQQIVEQIVEQKPSKDKLHKRAKAKLTAPVGSDDDFDDEINIC